MDEADLRKKWETNAFVDFLIRVMPTGQASKFSPPPPIKEFTYEPAKQERVEENDDNDEDDCNEYDNFVEDEVREYSRENFGPVSSPYLMPYMYKTRFLDTQYGFRKDGNMFMIDDSPVVVDTSGDTTIKDRVFKGSKSLWELLTRKKLNTEFITKDDLKT